MAHVLRKVDIADDGVKRWRFVGDAYVEGLMYGEADKMNVEEKEICLV